MAKSAKNQTLVTNWGRFVLGAFVFAWLNVAAQPCLMAMEMAGDSELMFGNTARSQHQVDQHADHNKDLSSDCGHCPPSGAGAHQGPCATMQVADCSDLPKSNVEGRSLKLQLKDVPGTFAMSQAPPQTAFVILTASKAPHTGVRLRFIDSPPLNLRYCVFLK